MFVVSSISSIFLVIFMFQCENVQNTEIQMDRIELLNSSYIEGYYNVSEFRITKFNRTSYVWNMNAALYRDLDESIEIEVTFHYNRLNNNQYNKSPMSLRKDKFCNIAEKYYRKFIMEPMKDVSNFPQLKPEEPVCPVKAVRMQ